MVTEKYKDTILSVLAEAGNDGLGVQKVSRHVYAVHNTLFEPLEFADVHKDVTAWLQAHSQDSGDFVERTSRGVYKLNMQSQIAAQLMLNFDEQPEVASTTTSETITELSLF